MSLLRPVLALALVPFAGCVVVVDGPGEFNADLVVSEHCGTVAIQLDAGDVSVVRADVADVQISWGSTGIADAPSVSATVDEDGVLWLTGDCSQGLSCGVDVALLVPSGVSLDVQTGSGDVVLSGTNGGARVETGSGDIALVCVSGELDLHTGAGDIAGSCLQSEVVTAHTGSGDVALGWTGPVWDAQITAGSGDVVLSVPLGAYDLDLATGSGDLVLIGITPDETADAHLAVTTSSGDVVVSGF